MKHCHVYVKSIVLLSLPSIQAQQNAYNVILVCTNTNRIIEIFLILFTISFMHRNNNIFVCML